MTVTYDTALAGFRQAYPAFETTAALDELRATEYARLDACGQTYLDYTGGGLYAASQLREHQAMLADVVLGNPHSQNLPSRQMTERIEATRAAILEFFHAAPEEYEVIFTPNATGALRLVGEAYPFGPGDQYLLTFDNHNSVNGIREFARGKGARVSYIAVDPAEMRVPHGPLAQILTHPGPGGHRLVGRLVDGLRGGRRGGHNLFAYPAQSNFSGVQHPLEWITEAQAAGWDVLLDAAAFVPTNRLDLSRWHPDYVTLSFYKIFGYPTGIGALLVRHQALAKLRRPWYAGGNTTFSSVQAAEADGGGFYRTPGAAGFEDGTLDYLLREGLPRLLEVYGHGPPCGSGVALLYRAQDIGVRLDAARDGGRVAVAFEHPPDYQGGERGKQGRQERVEACSRYADVEADVCRGIGGGVVPAVHHFRQQSPEGLERVRGGSFGGQLGGDELDRLASFVQLVGGRARARC